MSRPRTSDRSYLQRVRVRHRADAFAPPRAIDRDRDIALRRVRRRAADADGRHRGAELDPEAQGPQPDSEADESFASRDEHGGNAARDAETGLLGGRDFPLAWLTGLWRDLDPDAIDHALMAAHEMLRAARVVLDAADAVVEEQRRTRGVGAPRVRKIDLD